MTDRIVPRAAHPARYFQALAILAHGGAHSASRAKCTNSLRQRAPYRSGDRKFFPAQTAGAKNRRRLGVGACDQQRLGYDGFEEFQKTQARLEGCVLKALRSFCSRRADAVIVPSQYLARMVAGWGVPEAKPSLIYNAVEVLSLSRSALPLSTRINIVTAGRLVPWKQIDHLIEAVSRV